MLEVFVEAIFEQYTYDNNDKEVLLKRLESTYRGQNELNVWAKLEQLTLQKRIV